jgi:hypothetical protein
MSGPGAHGRTDSRFPPHIPLSAEPAQSARVSRFLAQGDERTVVHDIAMFVARQAEKLLAIAPHIAKVDRRLL